MAIENLHKLHFLKVGERTSDARGDGLTCLCDDLIAFIKTVWLTQREPPVR